MPKVNCIHIVALIVCGFFVSAYQRAAMRVQVDLYSDTPQEHLYLSSGELAQLRSELPAMRDAVAGAADERRSIAYAMRAFMNSYADVVEVLVGSGGKLAADPVRNGINFLKIHGIL